MNITLFMHIHAIAAVIWDFVRTSASYRISPNQCECQIVWGSSQYNCMKQPHRGIIAIKE